MPTLYPPEYPERPDAPLLAFGPSFAEEIARSVISAVWPDSDEPPHETDVRVAASLTMLEAFHPRDQVECMIGAQAVAMHAGIMDDLARAMRDGTPLPMAIRLRSNAAQMARAFSAMLRDLRTLQKTPLPARPSRPPPSSGPAPDAAPPPDSPPEAADPVPVDSTPEDKASDLPEDIKVRPDGTPGSLLAYAPKAPKDLPFVPREPPIMAALATRPKLWRMVNGPPSETPSEPAPAPLERRPTELRMPEDVSDPILIGDALTRFASARLDPNAKFGAANFDDEDSMVELELISTGGDPDLEAERKALIARHPDGKPIKTFHYGGKPPPDDPPDG